MSSPLIQTFLLLLSMTCIFCTTNEQGKLAVASNPKVIQNVTLTSDDGRCETNEIYIVDGERTLILTNSKMARDIDHIQNDEANLLNQVKSQDKIISFLKVRLKETESQTSQYLKALDAQASSNLKLAQQLKESETRLAKLLTEKLNLGYENERLRHKVQNDEVRLFDLEENAKKRNQEIDTLKRQVYGEYNQMVESLKSIHAKCLEDLRLKESSIKFIEAKQSSLEDKIVSCKTTCANKTDHTWIRNQLSLQDETIVLLKEQITSQAKSMSTFNQMLRGKNKAIENCNNQLQTQFETGEMIEKEVQQQSKIIQGQQQTISLLKQIDRDEDYLRNAKDIALKILQNTVYTMVTDIKTCNQEIVKGLKNRIDNLEKQQQPLELMVMKMRKTISAGQPSKEGVQSSNIDRLISSREKVISMMQQQIKLFVDMNSICSREIGHEDQILDKMNKFYRPISEENCNNLFSKIAKPEVKKYCHEPPDVEKETGLVKIMPDYEAEVGGNLTYICKNGLFIDRISKQDRVIVLCSENEKYIFPNPWPKCT